MIPDPEKKVIDAFQVTHVNSSPKGGDTAAPTTILVDSDGQVRLFKRPANLFSRFPMADLIQEIDQALQP